MNVKHFKGIVPKQIDVTVIDFCRKINPGSEPFYVDVIPASEAIIHECVHNVNRYVKENGGTAVTGWDICLHPYCMIEAEFHVIYKNNNGHYIDITPHKENIDKILFLEDNSLKYEGYQINNIRENISKSKIIDECINAWNEIYYIQNSGENKFKHGLLNIKGEQAQQLVFLNNFVKRKLNEFFKALRLKPSDYCICGSGLKYADCCKNK